jgi:non-ribosomal peptide synthetase component F
VTPAGSPTVPIRPVTAPRPESGAGREAALSTPGPVLPGGQRLERVFEQACDTWPDRLAVDSRDGTWTFTELDRAANQLARHLLARGIRPGDRVGLLLDDPVLGYLGMLAVLKPR